MIRLSAFADEISPDLDEQVAVLLSEDIHFLDLRSAWDTNVLDLSNEQVTQIKQVLDAEGIGVAAIGSPIGKVPIDASFDEQMLRLARAIELAHLFQTSYIRIFSFYAPGGAKSPSTTANREGWRNEAIRRLRAMTVEARTAGIMLLHENEKDIYGDTIGYCVDLLQSINDEHFQAVFDPANFIQCGQTPYPDAYDQLRPWLRYVHVKDAHPDGAVVPAGEGASRWPELLQRLHQDGYDGFFSLEPHLAASGQLSGFSGAEPFRRAVQALKGLLDGIGWGGEYIQ
jgi:3-dehydroshikimate dehydratase